MTEADRLAQNANVAPVLAALVVLAANRLGIRVRDFRARRGPPAACRERLGVIRTARAAGFNYCQIGRALNRDHSTVMQVERGRFRREG